MFRRIILGLVIMSVSGSMWARFTATRYGTVPLSQRFLAANDVVGAYVSTQGQGCTLGKVPTTAATCATLITIDRVYKGAYNKGNSVTVYSAPNHGGVLGRLVDDQRLYAVLFLCKSQVTTNFCGDESIVPVARVDSSSTENGWDALVSDMLGGVKDPKLGEWEAGVLATSGVRLSAEKLNRARTGATPNVAVLLDAALVRQGNSALCADDLRRWAVAPPAGTDVDTLASALTQARPQDLTGLLMSLAESPSTAFRYAALSQFERSPKSAPQAAVAKLSDDQEAPLAFRAQRLEEFRIGRAMPNRPLLSDYLRDPKLHRDEWKQWRAAQ